MSCRTRLSPGAPTLLLLCRAPGWPCTGHGCRTHLPSLALFSWGETPADTNTLPAFCHSNKVSSEEHRASPRVFREHTSLQHREHDWSQGSAGSHKMPVQLFSCPRGWRGHSTGMEGTHGQLGSWTDTPEYHSHLGLLMLHRYRNLCCLQDIFHKTKTNPTNPRTT